MTELLPFAIEGGAFGISLFLSYYLFKRFIKKEVIEPIEALQREQKEIKDAFEKYTDRLNGFVFRALRNNLDLSSKLTSEMNQVHSLLTENMQSMSGHVSKARAESFEALKKTNVLEQTADKLVKIMNALHEKTKVIETEVTQIGKDLVFVKTKVRKDEN